MDNMKCFHSNFTDSKLGYGQAPISQLALITKSYFSRLMMSHLSSTETWLMKKPCSNFSRKELTPSPDVTTVTTLFSKIFFLCGKNYHRSYVFASVRAQVTNRLQKPLKISKYIFVISINTDPKRSMWIFSLIRLQKQTNVGGLSWFIPEEYNAVQMQYNALQWS